MANLPWTAWHKVVKLRDDLLSGELPLAIFAADLYEVALQRGRSKVYEDPEEFFALTYPTYNLRELAREVVLRLAGRSDKAVRQLELTYGGGKTHALIALYHLVNDPEHLPDLPAVAEFVQHIGLTPPRARIAVLPFDKLDVEKGMEARSPDGKTRWLKQPWSVLAFQLAGGEGLRLLHAEGQETERESAPAENLLIELLRIPARESLATLVLLDEVLMYAREKVALEPVWRDRLLNFFQYLTQAVNRVDRAALVASLLATDPRKSDALGKEISRELSEVFSREKEVGIQPVTKEDVSEVLCRRFFKPESLRDRAAFRPHVVAALKGIEALDQPTLKEGKLVEERYLKSYPFHPDLTDVLYSKWTQLEGFQRTRGVLRIFAMALRDASGWDVSPLIGCNVFLSPARVSGLADATRELTSIASIEEHHGKRPDWSAILQGELEKARDVQRERPAMGHREAEQAVIATFLHSQPVGQKARTRDLLLLLGHTRPDRIELEQTLQRWAELSWFLDEEGFAEESAEQPSAAPSDLPRTWRLGPEPNLKQMHFQACQTVQALVDPLVEAKVREAKRLAKVEPGLTSVRVHVLPERPSDVEDDGEFHFVILHPQAASAPGDPSRYARRFLDETTGPDRPRVNRNSVVALAPSPDGREAARSAARDCLAWEAVREQLAKQPLDAIRAAMLSKYIDDSLASLSDAAVQAYCVVVTVDQKNEDVAFRISPSGASAFAAIRVERQARIQDGTISAEALLPGGPYELWRTGETSRRLDYLAGAFAQHPHLPKMLSRKAVLDTIVQGCVRGTFVLRLTRPDRSVRTYWREPPEDSTLKDPALEVVLPEAVTLTQIDARLLAPGVLPDLWRGSELALGDLHAYFAGGNVVQVVTAGYSEPQTVPKAEPPVVDAAVKAAVQSRALWLISGTASLWNEAVPPGVLTPESRLYTPPEPIAVVDLLPEKLPMAWPADVTSGMLIAIGLSDRAGKTLPWTTVNDAINDALRARVLELTPDSGPWPCTYAELQRVRLRAVSETRPREVPGRTPQPATFVAAATVNAGQIQNLADKIGAITEATAGHDLRMHLRVELSAETPKEVVSKANELLGEVSEELQLRTTDAGSVRGGTS